MLTKLLIPLLATLSFSLFACDALRTPESAAVDSVQTTVPAPRR